MKLPQSVRFLIDGVQVVLILCLYIIFYPMPMGMGSAIVGWLVGAIGPHLPHSRRILDNLTKAMPTLTHAERQTIVRGVWCNLGRTLIEYCYLPRLRGSAFDQRIEIVGGDILASLKNDGKPAFLFLGHLANWEIGTLVALRAGLSVTQVYRTLNYPMTDWLIHRIHKSVATSVIAKGSEGARQMLSALKKGDHISLLMDQKLNEGEWIPFFGMPAKTAPAAARLSLRFDCPLVPVRVERLKGMTFRVTFYPPLRANPEAPQEAQIRTLLTDANRHLEDWIRERPEQWFWLHRRWPR